MKNVIEIKRKSDELEYKVKELEGLKRKTMLDEFYLLPQDKAFAFMSKIKDKQNEIKLLKIKIDKLEEMNEELKKKYDKVTHDGDLWLGDVINIENPKFTKKNLIISPVGSGKTYAIKELLSKTGGYYQLMLVSTSSLKDSILASEEDSEGQVFSSSKKIKIKDGDKDYILHVMTYAEFGYRIRNNDDFIRENNIERIYCDEVHSLIEYKKYSSDERYVHAMRYLFNKDDSLSIYYFTATTEHIDKLRNADKEKFKNMKVFDYRNYPNIKKYINLNIQEISHTEQLRELLRGHSEDFINYGYKGLAFQSTIKSQLSLAEILEDEGFSPLVLWSTKNVEHKMDDVQLKARDELLKTGKIPEGYNFLIINGAMREGWNLTDEKVELAIINTTSETDAVQARGRIRKNISTMIVRVESTDNSSKKIKLSDKFLNSDLEKADKDNLVNEVDMRDNLGRQMKWRAIKTILESSGYLVKDKVKRVNGKQVRFTVITKK